MQVTADDPDRPWAEPGVYEVADGLYRIPLPLPDAGLKAVNVYAIADPTGLHLIDSGQATEDARAALTTALDALGLALTDVLDVSTTHMHIDHYTNGTNLRRSQPLWIRLGEHEAPSMAMAAEPGQMPMAAQITLLRRAGAPELADVVGTWKRDPTVAELFTAPDEWVVDGSTVVLPDRSLTAVHTPGHTRGHVVYHDEQRAMMFTGDHILPRITPSIGLEPVPPARPLAEFMSSLHRVRSLPDALMLPAHGAVTAGVHARVDALLQHHDDRLLAIEKRVRHGDATAFEVASNLPWTRRETRLADLDHFNQMMAVIETAAHLDVLADQGRVTVRDDRPAVYTAA